MKAICVTSALIILSALQACSRAEQSNTAASTTNAAAQSQVATAAAGAPKEHAQPTACSLVTQDEMSQILGAAVTAEPNEHSNGKTKCTYKAAKGISPYVELAVEWGEGEAALRAAGAMGKAVPGISNPYEGIGDQAAAVGPTLWIRTGDDLMTIVFSGVEGAPEKAKKIFNTAKPRM